jgi:hypothetical protein
MLDEEWETVPVRCLLLDGDAWVKMWDSDRFDTDDHVILYSGDYPPSDFPPGDSTWVAFSNWHVIVVASEDGFKVQ